MINHVERAAHGTLGRYSSVSFMEFTHIVFQENQLGVKSGLSVLGTAEAQEPRAPLS